MPVDDESGAAETGDDAAHGEDGDRGRDLQQDDVGSGQPEQHAQQQRKELPYGFAHHAQGAGQVADERGPVR